VDTVGDKFKSKKQNMNFSRNKFTGKRGPARHEVTRIRNVSPFLGFFTMNFFRCLDKSLTLQQQMRGDQYCEAKTTPTVRSIGVLEWRVVKEAEEGAVRKLETMTISIQLT
jgi:hypothetical protein